MSDPFRQQLPPGLAGVRVVVSDMVADGEVFLIAGSLFIGTRPRTPREEARLEAVRIVQEGLADVLDWLGWPRWSPPASGLDICRQLGIRVVEAES